MEGVNEVKGKRKRTRPRGGRRAGQFVRTLVLIRLRSGVKRFSYVWRKASRPSGWPTKWASGEAPCPRG